jgi:hypothetical protein
VLLQSTTSDLRFAVTNVYGSADHSHTDLFLSDLHDIAAIISNPAWIPIRDLNLTHYPPPADKSTPTFNASLASHYNQVIDALQLIELPLLDHLFTWTNKRAEPTLARLDRAFFNIGFGDGFPGATLTSSHCPTSDHTPLIASIQTNIPKPNAFKLERSWLLDHSFPPLSSPSLAVYCLVRGFGLGLGCSDQSGSAGVKCLAASLAPEERCLRDWCSQRLHLYLCQWAAYWKLRGRM